MDQVAKPSGFADSFIPEKNSERVRVRKPSPPNESQLEAKPSTSPTRDNPDSDLRGFVVVDRPPKGQNEGDFGFRNAINMVKSLDANRYATKKTIAQGMLDIALLTANASQLKYILQVGKQHEFYTLMLTLICVSISLQIVSGLLSLSLNLLRDRRMEDSKYAFSVEWIGRIRVALSFIVFLDNIMIAAFDPMGLSSILAYDGSLAIPPMALVGILFIIVGGLDINRRRDHRAADIINDILQGIICILLGSNFNINKTQDQHKANIWNNITLALMLLTVAVNVIISAFEMRSSDGIGTNSTKALLTQTVIR